MSIKKNLIVSTKKIASVKKFTKIHNLFAEFSLVNIINPFFFFYQEKRNTGFIEIFSPRLEKNLKTP